MKIREMLQGDIPAVVEIENQNFRDPWTPAIFEEEMAQGTRSYYIAEIDDQVIGYMGLIWILDEGHITNVAVDAKHQGKGYGRALMTHVANLGFKRSLTSMTLEVRASNARAIHLYESLGFINEGTRPKYYEGLEDAYIMWLYKEAWDERTI